MNVTLRFPDEAIMKIVVDDLVLSYRTAESDANLPKQGLKPYQLTNRKDARKIRKALLKVIKFYTTEAEFQELNLVNTPSD